PSIDFMFYLSVVVIHNQLSSGLRMRTYSSPSRSLPAIHSVRPPFAGAVEPGVLSSGYFEQRLDQLRRRTSTTWCEIDSRGVWITGPIFKISNNRLFNPGTYCINLSTIPSDVRMADIRERSKQCPAGTVQCRARRSISVHNTVSHAHTMTLDDGYRNR